MTEETVAALDALEAALASWREGYLRVLDVSTRTGEDSDGEEAIYFDLVLPTPQEDDETWPVDAILSLQRAFVDAARETFRDSEFSRPLYLTLRPEDEEEPEESDARSVATG